MSVDQVTIDCGDEPVEPGDEVVLMGEQGGDVISADDIAGWAGTIADETVCRITERAPRTYVGARPGTGPSI